MKTKRCLKCKVTKPLKMFTTNSQQKDGRHVYCKLCCRDWARDYYKKNKAMYFNARKHHAQDLGIEWRMKPEHFVGMRFNEDVRIACRRIDHNKGFTPGNVVIYNFKPRS